MDKTTIKMTKKLPTYIAIWNYIEAVILLAAGICFLAFCNNETMKDIFLIVVGALLLADGALRIIGDFLPLFYKKDKKDFHFGNIIPGAFELALGITFVSTDIIAVVGIFATFIGVLMVVGGAFFIVFGIAFIVRKLYKIYMPVSEIVLGVVLAVLGSLVLAFVNGDMMLTIFLVVLGLLFVVAAVALTVYTTTTLKAMRALSKAFREEAKKAEEAEEMAETKTVPDAEFDMTKEENKEEEPKAIEEEKPALENKEDKEETPQN